jgi:hypothetical protein
VKQAVLQAIFLFQPEAHANKNNTRTSQEKEEESYKVATMDGKEAYN